jgi:hypothetical protein
LVVVCKDRLAGTLAPPGIFTPKAILAMPEIKEGPTRRRFVSEYPVIEKLFIPGLGAANLPAP